MEKLVKTLTAQLTGILQLSESKLGDSNLFEPTPYTYQKSTFFQKGELAGAISGYFGSEMDLPLFSQYHSYLRLYPKHKVAPIQSLKQTRLLAHSFRSMGRATNGFSFGRNQYGAFSAQHEKDVIFSMKQLFQSKELWAIDSFSLDPQNSLIQTGRYAGVLAYDIYKEELTSCLQSYLEAYKKHLEVEPPLVLEVGFSGIKNFRLFWKGEGRFLTNEIEKEILINDYNTPVEEILSNYFAFVEDQAG